jgi:hypothetical protein
MIQILSPKQNIKQRVKKGAASEGGTASKGASRAAVAGETGEQS